MLSISSLSQATLPSASSQDIYKNFLGSWEGASERVDGPQIVRETIELTVTEDPKKHGIRMDYAYKGKTIDKRTRFLELLPEKHKIKMHFNGQTTDTYNATGLTEFETTDMGDFACYRTSDSTDAKKVIDRVTFHLDHDSFKYEWARESDGKTYGTYSMFMFKRKA
jgi:hypothetical protein